MKLEFLQEVDIYREVEVMLYKRKKRINKQLQKIDINFYSTIHDDYIYIRSNENYDYHRDIANIYNDRIEFLDATINEKMNFNTLLRISND